jgi:hypothetical protein
MGGCSHHKDNLFAWRNPPVAMDDREPHQRPAGDRLIGNAAHFRLGHAGEMLKLKR